MGLRVSSLVNFKTALHLGRVSNLPTVWSNVLAAVFISTAVVEPRVLLLLMVAMTLLYLGGMFLNDAFDADWDRVHKPVRPVPSNAASQQEVFFYGYALLFAGPLLLLALGLFNGALGIVSSLSAFVLAIIILLYDVLHKRFSMAPWLMGLCRMMVYVTAGVAVGEVSLLLLWAGFSLLAYIVGLTYCARAEHLNVLDSWWPILLFIMPLIFAVSQLPRYPASGLFIMIFAGWLVFNIQSLLPGEKRNIGKAIGSLLAGIPLFDAMVLAGVGQWMLAFIAIVLFVMTRILHAIVPGT